MCRLSSVNALVVNMRKVLVVIVSMVGIELIVNMMLVIVMASSAVNSGVMTCLLFLWLSSLLFLNLWPIGSTCCSFVISRFLVKPLFLLFLIAICRLVIISSVFIMYSVGWKIFSSVMPVMMKMVCRISALMMLNVSTLVFSVCGMVNDVSSIVITNMLSSDSVFLSRKSV